MFENRHALDEEETRIHEMIREMYQHATNAMELAIESLMSQDPEIADSVVKKDNELNELTCQVEKECLLAVATQQPTPQDVLDIIASLQISTELERIGDHAKDIAKIVMGMDPTDFSGPMDQISAMSNLCQDMLVQAMDAYGRRDVELAKDCANDDHEVDELKNLASSSLLMQLATKPDQGMHCTHLLWIAYHLERIGDRTKNIAERVVFMVTAETPDLD